VVISGSGNVATHAAENTALGGNATSPLEGFIHDPNGIDQAKIDWIRT
jgi:glutamate dehydrogenase (NADP+)